MNKINVCYSHPYYHFYENKEQIVVIIDIVRATTTICTALHHGAEHIKAVATVEEALELKNHGYLAAGERKGMMLPGFDFGNSPLEFMNGVVENKKIAMSTTNGTQAIKKSAECRQILIGSFINESALVNYLETQDIDVLLLCSGASGHIAVEDLLFAGKVIEDLIETGKYQIIKDDCSVALQLFRSGKENLHDFALSCSSRLNWNYQPFKEDLKFCFQNSIYKVLPHLNNGIIIDLLKQ